MKLTRNYIRNMLGMLIYTRAEEVHSSGKIMKMNTQVSSRGTSIRAVVGGTFRYNVEVDIPDDEDLLYLRCDCMAYEAFGRCKHIGAVLLEYVFSQEEEQKAASRPPARFAPAAPARPVQKRIYNNPGAALLLTKYNRETPENAADDVRLVPQLDFVNGRPVAGFTIGDKTQYVIKDLCAFNNSMETGETVTYGAKLTFCHKESLLDEKSRRLWDMIRSFISEQSLYAGASAHTTVRYMPLSGRAFDELFDLFAGEDVPGKESGQKWRMADENPALSICSETVGEHVQVTLDPSALAVRGAKHDYAVVGNTVYRMTEEYAEAMLPMMDIARTASLLFSPKGAPDCCSQVLPVIEKHAPVKNAEGLTAYIPDKPEIRFYIDLPKRGLLTAKPVFAYGEKLISPDTPVSENPDIKRDEYREKNAVKALLTHFDPPKEKGEAYTIEDEERMFAFLTKGMQDLSEYG